MLPCGLDDTVRGDLPYRGEIELTLHHLPDLFLGELRFLPRREGISEGLFMDQIKLGLREGLVLCRIHYALSKIPNLRVESSICFNVHKPIKVIPLGHAG